jgi:hypothetical protein
MRPHPRIRKTIKWGGLALAALLLGVCLASRWWWVEWRGSGPQNKWISLKGGRLVIGTARDVLAGLPAPGWHVYREGWPFYFEFRWWFDWKRSPFATLFAVPLWVPAVFALLLAASAWRLDTLARRRTRAGHCPSCGYDLTGLIAPAPCPECGRP